MIQNRLLDRLLETIQQYHEDQADLWQLYSAVATAAVTLEGNAPIFVIRALAKAEGDLEHISRTVPLADQRAGALRTLQEVDDVLSLWGEAKPAV
ncbi:MAG: hypothetical protein ACYC5Y_03875 [Symbiobacteriia bacterium]